MGRTGKIPLAVALGITAVAFLFVMIQLGRGCHRKIAAKRVPYRPYWCETCQEEFMARWQSDTARCPKCTQQRSILRYYHVCDKCSHRFLACDLDKPNMAIRFPGEEWGPMGPPPVFECPKCKSQETSLEEYKKR